MTTFPQDWNEFIARPKDLLDLALIAEMERVLNTTAPKKRVRKAAKARRGAT